MIKGLFLLLLFLALGEGTALLTHQLLPGSIFGMLYLFTSLMAGWVNPDSIRSVAKGLTQNMALFFVPAAVGIMAAGDSLRENGIAILLSVLSSTILMFWVVATIQQHRSRNQAKRKEDQP